MKWTRRKRLSPPRIAFMTLLMLTTCAVATAAVRSLPTSWEGNLAAALFGVGVLLITASLIEWMVHRYIYHRRLVPFLGRIFAIHHQGHHHVIFPTWRYVTNGPVRRHPIVAPDVSSLYKSLGRNLVIKVCHFSFYMGIGLVFIWLPAWLLTGNVAFLTGIIVASVVVSDLFVRVHDAIHYPGRFRFIEAQPWFGFLERHHYIHHVDTEANVNFLLPLTDWLFGTMRRSLTPEELARHGSLEEAKAHPVGMSEPARVVARPRRHANGAVAEPQEAYVGR